jgi:hypothetical protein
MGCIKMERQLFEVRLGLGRMASHHTKTYQIEAATKFEASSLARCKFYAEVENEIGKDAPIWGKMLTVEYCKSVS